MKFTKLDSEEPRNDSNCINHEITYSKKVLFELEADSRDVTMVLSMLHKDSTEAYGKGLDSSKVECLPELQLPTYTRECPVWNSLVSTDRTG